MAKGRPRKYERTTAEILSDVRVGKPLTYDETAKLIGSVEYVPKGKTTPLEARSVTAMGVYKIEQRALAKLKALLGTDGVKCLADAIDVKRQAAVARQNVLCSEVY